MHGFGEIVENTAETASYMKILAARFPQEISAVTMQETQETANSEAETGASERADGPAEEELAPSQKCETVKFPFSRSAVEKVTCPNCNRTQYSSRNKCYHCGTEFHFADEDQ